MLLFLLGQTLAWYQTNGQFISTWIKEHPILVAAIGGIPVGYSYILGTTYLVQAFDGAVWPSRLLGFSMGILAFTTAYLNPLKRNHNTKNKHSTCTGTNNYFNPSIMEVKTVPGIKGRVKSKKLIKQIKKHMVNKPKNPK